MIRSEPTTDDGVQSLEDRDQLERGFRRLKPEQRAVVVLHFYVGLPVPEIAETLGIPAGTVKSRLHYATETLRAALDADARDRSPPTDRQHDPRSIGRRADQRVAPRGGARPAARQGAAGDLRADQARPPTSRVPGWRHFPMTHVSPATIAVGAAAILVLAVGAALLPQTNPSVGAMRAALPIATPTSSPADQPDHRPANALRDLIERPDRVRANGRWQHRPLPDEPGSNGSGASDQRPGRGREPRLVAGWKRIVFRRIVDGASDFFVMNADGSDARHG